MRLPTVSRSSLRPIGVFAPALFRSCGRIHITDSFSSQTIRPLPTPTSAAPGSQIDEKKTHYLVTLRRSPIHLPKAVAATCRSLGLGRRLKTSLVPITKINAGYVLSVKELVSVRNVTLEEAGLREMLARRLSPGEGRRGSGWLARADGEGVIRIGSQRCNGDERGFRIARPTQKIDLSSKLDTTILPPSDSQPWHLSTEEAGPQGAQIPLPLQ